jgi:hypothetical protein
MALRQRFGGLLALLAATIVGAAGQAPLSRGSEAVAPSRMSGDWRSSAPAVIAATPGTLAGGADLGPAPAGARLERMLLLLQPSPQQRQALDAELADQQDATSPEYHRWLTPSQFAERYANSASDVAAVGAWLESEGFAVASLPAGRGWIEFSGTVGQVERAFHTHVHSVSTGSGERVTLAGGEVSVPAALKPLIHGLVSLDAVVAEPAITRTQAVVSAVADVQKAASPAQAEGLTPQLAVQLLHLEASGTTGDGEFIAIVGRSNVREQDVALFRALFGLPANPVQVVLNGNDPGRTADEGEAVLLASWAGAIAPKAQIVLVSSATTAATDGVDLSLAATVDKVAAHTVVVGYSACEPALSETHRAFYGALYRQAAAQGMSVIVAAGDSGAAACHAAGSNAAVTTGLAVNGLAATPWNTGAGAVAFSASGTGQLAAWSPVDPADPAYASGGGSSMTTGAPGWQPVLMPNASGRMLPDIVLPTALDSGASRGLAFCFSGAGQAAVGCRLVRAGGSSAAAAIFGGISALLAEKYGAQGNLAPRLYALQGQAGVFTDVQQGSTRLTCAAGSPDCDASGYLGFDAGAGYDLATGLGVPNAEKLINAWPAAIGTGAVTVNLAITPPGTSTIYNPSATIYLSAAVTPSVSGGPMPTGTVNFYDSTTSRNLNSVPVNVDVTGTASGWWTGSNFFTAGANPITAQYSGDSNYAASASAPLQVYVQQSIVNIALSASNATPAPGQNFTVTAVLSVTGLPAAGPTPPTGAVSLSMDGGVTPYATASLSTSGGVTSATFNISIAAAGHHQLTATYAGDANYRNTSPGELPVAVGFVNTSLTITPSTYSPRVGSSFTVTVGASTANGSVAPTGTVTLNVDGAAYGTAILATGGGATSAVFPVTLTTSGVHTIQAVYPGDANYNPSSSSISVNAGTSTASVALSVFPLQANATYNPSAAITVTAVVSSQNGGATPTGTLNFIDQTTGNSVGSGAITLDSSGKASVMQSVWSPIGGHSIVGRYSGDGTYASVTSQVLTLNIQPSTTTPTVTPSTTTPIVGASFTVTVTIAAGSPPAGTVPPTGNVTLTVDGAPKSTAALSTSGGTTSASFTASVASAGGHNLQAIYAGDTNYGTSTSPSVSVNASKGATVTTLTASPATLTAGTAESFTATIAAENPVAGQTNTFTGTVTFFDGTAQLGTAPVSANGATLSNATLSSAATHVITAVYSGDGNWAGSTSNAVTLKAVLFPVTVTLAATPAAAGPGQVVSLTATVTPSVAPASTAEQNPTGSVIFYNGTTVIGTVALSASLNFSSTATLITGNLPSGTDVVTAYYVGDQFYSAATSNPVTLSVQDFSITAPSNSPADLDILKGSSGQASFIVTALGGFATEMQLVCTVPTQADMTCLPSPIFVTPTATVTFTVQTFAAGGISTSSSHPAPLWPRALGGTALAGLVFLVLPFGRRARVFTGRIRGVMVIGLLLIGLGGAGIGCSNSVTAPVNNGTPLGMTTLTITGAAYVDNTVISHSVYLAVNVLPSNSTGTAVPARGSRRK